MNYDCGSERQLSTGALQFLSEFKISEKKRIIYVNFILQIYQCVPLLHSEYFSCSLFDKENICNAFILKYNKSEGRPYSGDIISVTKIIVSTLNNGENRLYNCEETKLLEKNKKFLINPKILKNISSKQKLESKDNKDNIKNSSKKNKLGEIKEKEENKEESQIDIDYFSKENNIFSEEIPDYNYNMNDNLTNSNNIINENGGETSTEKKPKKEIKHNSNEKAIKIKPQKKDDISQKEKDMILESINPFLDEFEEGIILSENTDNNPINNKKEESLDYSLLSKRTKNEQNSIKQNSGKNNTKENFKDVQFKYIEEINRILLGFQNIPVNFCYKIKCRVDKFDIGKNNLYNVCSVCNKKIDKDIICCKGGYKKFLYSFFVKVRDPSGICNVYFDDREGNNFMGITAEKYNYFLTDQTPIGRIILSEYKKDFFNNEFMIWLQFPEDVKNKSKIYKAVKVERIVKVHRYDMINELKNILI